MNTLSIIVYNTITKFNSQSAAGLTEDQIDHLTLDLIHALSPENMTQFNPEREAEIAEKLIALARQVQSDEPEINGDAGERAARLAGLGVDYRAFYRRAMNTAAAFNRPDLQEIIKAEYEGRGISGKVSRFLESGTNKSIIGKGYAFPVDRCFAEPIRRQVDALFSIGWPGDADPDLGAELIKK